MVTLKSVSNRCVHAGVVEDDVLASRMLLPEVADVIDDLVDDQPRVVLLVVLTHFVHRKDTICFCLP